jgi:gas vesicle protein
MSKTSAYHFAIEFPAGYVGPYSEITVRLSYLPGEDAETQARETALKSAAKVSGVPAEKLVVRLTRTEHMPDGFDPLRDLEDRWPILKDPRVSAFKEVRRMANDVAEDEGSRVTVTSTETETWIQGPVAQETAREIARIREEGAQKVARIREEGAQKVARIREDGTREVTRIEAEIAEIARAARAQGEEDRRAIRARYARIRDKMLDGVIATGLVVFAIWSPLPAVATLAIVLVFVVVTLLVRE